jgi:uncharacterized protein (TIGR03435 family)
MCLRLISAFVTSVVLVASSAAQQASTFEVASVRPSKNTVGPDYNNQLAWSAAAFTARNATFRRLIAVAWGIQLKQVVGPSWLDSNEYDIQARLTGVATKAQQAAMLKNLLNERFNLKQHSETRNMRVYELTVSANGPKIKPGAVNPQAGPGFQFHGDMRQFADLLALQFSIPAAQSPDQPVRAGGPATPVVDKTGLDGIYDFNVDVRPELGTDAFTGWQRVLKEQLGLEIESRKEDVQVLVVDDAEKTPTEN